MATNPKMATTAEIEAHVRKLLDLPPCTCGQGLDCPEIFLNGISDDRVDEVLAYLKENGQDKMAEAWRTWLVDEEEGQEPEKLKSLAFITGRLDGLAGTTRYDLPDAARAEIKDIADMVRALGAK